MKLPRAQQNLPEWQTATEALIMAAEDRGPLLHAREVAGCAWMICLNSTAGYVDTRVDWSEVIYFNQGSG
jgi:hypothetical protein